VLAAFRAQKKRRGVAPWVLAIAAAVLLTGFVSVLLKGPSRQVLVENKPVIQAPKPVVPEPVQVASVPTVVKKRPVRRSAPKVVKEASAQPLETWSDFVPVPYAPPIHAGDGAQLLRVRLPRNPLQSFGIPRPADRINDRFNAEVMVGQDGVVRAIRFAK
jgi:hypothetical protein